jgi:hypothetical protein
MALALLLSMVGVADSKHGRHHLTVNKLVRDADGKARGCDFDHDRRYGPKQSECVIRVVWPGHLEDEAVSVAWCESVMDATPPPNPASTADGLFQFLDGTWATTPQFREVFRKAKRHGASYGHAIDLAYQAVRDPVLNARAALWLYLTGGRWRQWVCKP